MTWWIKLLGVGCSDRQREKFASRWQQWAIARLTAGSLGKQANRARALLESHHRKRKGNWWWNRGAPAGNFVLGAWRHHDERHGHSIAAPPFASR